MIKTQYFYKRPNKEPPVLIMDILVRGGQLLIFYTRRVEEPLVRGILEERDKIKNISFSIAGERRIQ